MTHLLKQLRSQYLVEHEHDRYYSEHEIAKMSAPSEHNTNTICVVKNVVFDQINGMGATPYNRDVFYFGFVVMMTPYNFLRLAAAGGKDREIAGNKMIKEIKKGRSIASPFLLINGYTMKEDEAPIVGHEGRARCNALINLGLADELVPIHFITAPVRARDITEEMVKRVANNLVSEVTRLKRPHTFSTFYLKNIEYKV